MRRLRFDVRNKEDVCHVCTDPLPRWVSSYGTERNEYTFSYGDDLSRNPWRNIEDIEIRMQFNRHGPL